MIDIVKTTLIGMSILIAFVLLIFIIFHFSVLAWIFSISLICAVAYFIGYTAIEIYEIRKAEKRWEENWKAQNGLS